MGMWRNRGLLILVLVFLWGVPVRAADDNPFADLISGTKVYFSHIAAGVDGWETEIAIFNPTPTPVSGTLISYNATGRPVGDAVPVSLAAHGRYEAEVSKSFTGAAEIAYMVFSADVFGLQGYSKFYRNGIRASIMASGPRTTGLFAKIDPAGWTGIAFINTAAAATAHITLTAYDNGGNEIAVASKELLSGAKAVDVAGSLFSQSIDAATYISFTSDCGVVGFFLNGSYDDTQLDGLHAL